MRRAGKVGIGAMLGAGIVGAGLSAACMPAHAADLPTQPALPATAPPQSASDWRFQATLYGWLPAVSGEVGVRNLPDIAVNSSASDLLEGLNGAFMGSFFAMNDTWVLLADVVYASVSESGEVGAFGGSHTNVDLTQTVLTGAVGYMLPTGRDDLDLAVTGGLRYVSLSARASLTPYALPLTLSDSESKSWIDPTVGLFAHWTISDKWFVNAVVDIGGFGVGSKLSSTGYAGLSYMWTPSISSSLGYRYLYEDFEDAGHSTGRFRYNTTMHGPLVGLAWHF